MVPQYATASGAAGGSPLQPAPMMGRGIGMRRRRVCGANGGGVIVEVAVIAPLMVLLLFGMVELGLQLRTATQLNSLAREAARAASAGESYAACWSRVQEAGVEVDLDELSMAIDYAEHIYGAQWSSCWAALPSRGSNTDAPLRSLIRVRLTYNHRLFLPSLFSYMADDQAAGTKQMNIITTMVRS